MESVKLSGKAIRNIRHLKGIKQEEAGKLLSISQQAFSKMENSDKIKNVTILKIMKAFKCSAAEFERINGYPPPEN